MAISQVVGLRSGSWGQFAILYVSALVATASMGMVPPLAGDLATALHVTVPAIGACLALQLVPAAFAGTAFGSAADRFGPQRLIVLSSLLVAAGDLVELSASSIAWLGAGLLIQGCGITGVLASGQVIVAATSSGTRQAQRLTVWSTANFMGFAAGLFLAARFAGTEGWPNLFAVHAVPCIVLAGIGLALPRVSRSSAPERLAGIFRELGVVRLGIALGLASLAGVGTNAVASLFLHDAHGVPLGVSASAVAIGNLLSIVGSFAAGWALSRRVSSRTIAYTVILIATASGCLLYARWIPFGAALASLYVYQAAASGIVALVYATMPRLLSDPSRLGSATGMLVQLSVGGAMLGAPVFFWVLASGRWIDVALAVAVCWISALLLMPVRRAATHRPLAVAEEG